MKSLHRFGCCWSERLRLWVSGMACCCQRLYKHMFKFSGRGGSGRAQTMMYLESVGLGPIVTEFVVNELS
jgi:hypothetical protein